MCDALLIVAPLPFSAYTPAMIGADALVPPTTRKPPYPYVSFTETPVAGSATADTSEIMRLAQFVSCCHAGLAMIAEHPLPAPDQTVSCQPRALPSVVSVVPPTAVT